MLDRCKIRIRFIVPVRVIRFVYRSFPCRQISHSHGIFPAVILRQCKSIVHRHMVDRKLQFLFRQQRRLQCPQRGKRPAGAESSLIAHCCRPSLLPQIIAGRYDCRTVRRVHRRRLILLYIPGIGIIQIIRQIIQAYIVGIVLADKRRHDHLTGSVDFRLRGAQ